MNERTPPIDHKKQLDNLHQLQICHKTRNYEIQIIVRMNQQEEIYSASLSRGVELDRSGFIEFLRRIEKTDTISIHGNLIRITDLNASVPDDEGVLIRFEKLISQLHWGFKNEIVAVTKIDKASNFSSQISNSLTISAYFTNPVHNARFIEVQDIVQRSIRAKDLGEIVSILEENRIDREQKNFILIGLKNTGKGTLAKVIQEFGNTGRIFARIEDYSSAYLDASLTDTVQKISLDSINIWDTPEFLDQSTFDNACFSMLKNTVQRLGHISGLILVTANSSDITSNELSLITGFRNILNIRNEQILVVGTNENPPSSEHDSKEPGDVDQLKSNGIELDGNARFRINLRDNNFNNGHEEIRRLLEYLEELVKKEPAFVRQVRDLVITARNLYALRSPEKQNEYERIEIADAKNTLNIILRRSMNHNSVISQHGNSLNIATYKYFIKRDEVKLIFPPEFFIKDLDSVDKILDFVESNRLVFPRDQANMHEFNWTFTRRQSFTLIEVSAAILARVRRFLALIIEN